MVGVSGSIGVFVFTVVSRVRCAGEKKVEERAVASSIALSIGRTGGPSSTFLPAEVALTALESSHLSPLHSKLQSKTPNYSRKYDRFPRT